MRNPLSLLRRPAPLLDKAPVPYSSRSSAGLPWFRQGGTESQMRAMGSVGTLFSIVDRLASSTGAGEWRLYRTAQPGQRPEDRQEVTRHLALDIWRRPNPFFTQSLFVETTQQHFELVGEEWWVVVRSPRARTIPLEIWPVRPDRMHPIPDPEDYLVGYMYMGPDGQQISLELDEVIHIRRPNPVDAYRGFGAVQTILSDLEGVRLSAEWNRNFFLNSAEPGGIVEIDRRLSDDEYEEMVARWREQHQGTSNAHRVAMLEGGARWVERAYTRRDMQFTEMRSVSSSVIREAFGIPKFAVGDVEDINRATAEASKAWFAEQMTVPRLERIKQALNYQFLPMFGTAGQGVEFDYISPVPADREGDNAELTSRATAVKTLMDAGLPSAYAITVAGLPDLPPELTAQEQPEQEDAPAPDQPAEDDDTAAAKALAEIVQKLYLGVDTVVTWEEARAILVQGGADIDPAAGKPEPPEPAAPFGGEEGEDAPGEEPAEDAPEEAPPGEEDQEEPDPPANRLTIGHAPGLANAADDEPAEHLNSDDLPGIEHLAEQLQDILDTLLDAWGPISAAQKENLVDQVKAAAVSGGPEDLADLDAPATQDAEDALTDAMVEIAALAAESVVDEAADQDVELEKAEPERDALRQVAAGVTKGLARDLATSAGREAARVTSPEKTAEQVSDAVADHLGSLTDAQPRMRLHNALHSAQHAGRAATFEAAEEKHAGEKLAPVPAYYGNERNDERTCGPCKEIDGRWLGNTYAEALRDYPLGGYERCEGRDRCRGQVVSVWRPKQVKKD